LYLYQYHSPYIDARVKAARKEYTRILIKANVYIHVHVHVSSGYKAKMHMTIRM